MNRAYSLLTLKTVDEERREIKGIATTPTPDRLGDIIEPLGVSFADDLPLLHQHDHLRPVGRVKFGKPTNNGIEFDAKLPRIDEPPSLKDRIDTAWAEVKAGLIRGVSIGFRPIDHEPLDAKDPWGARRFTKSEVLELSLVTVPANADAQISLIRSLDTASLAASGTKQAASKATQAGVSASELLKSKVKPMENLTESITRYQRELVTKTEQRDALLANANKEGRTLNESEDEQFETLDVETKSLAKHLTRLGAMEQTKAASAKPAAPAPAPDNNWTIDRPFSVVRTAPDLAPGIRFARYAKLKAMAKLDGMDVERLAQRMYPGDNHLVEMLTRAAVAAATSTHATWAGPLVNPEGFAEFLEYLRPMTILGKFGTNGVPSLTKIPFRIPVVTQTGGGAAYWVGEGKAKPLTSFAFARATLSPLKVANIAVATMESLRDSSPAADALIRNGLASAIAARLDIDFIDPAKAAVANVSPASITNGVTPIASEGVDADAVRADMNKLFTQFAGANNPISTGVIVTSSSIAATLAMMTNPLGQPEFSTVSRSGGSLFTYPLIVSDYVAVKTLVLVNAQDIVVADDGGVDVAMSDQASLEMSDAPTGDSAAGTGAALVSMFQTNSVAFRAERTINWQKARAQSVSLLNDIDWGGTETP